MRSEIADVVERVSHLLPAQGPITVFIHHNTLHAFEHLPFDEAVVRGGRLFGCEPYLSEERYRAKLARGRWCEADLRAVLADDPGSRGAGRSAAFAPREELRAAWLLHGIPDAEGPALEWLLRETDALDAPRADLPPRARERWLGPGPAGRGARAEVRALWQACCSLVAADVRPAAAGPRGVRHRDYLAVALDADPDALVHPLLIRLAAAFLDQGLASWTMPGREQGFYHAVLRLYSRGGGPPDRFTRALRRLLVEEAAAGRTPAESIAVSLEALGVAPAEREEFLTATALALRGWAGMMRQIEVRPDRVPVEAPPARLADFLAIRLLLDRVAAAEVWREAGRTEPLADLRRVLAAQLPAAPAPALAERAWPVFHLAQLLGRGAGDVARLAGGDGRELLAEIEAFDAITRRRLLHEAYERSLRRAAYDALSGPPPAVRGTPRFQAVFCLDEREESMRRHLEEVAPAGETLGAAGFFGVAMYYRGAEETHARPLCPVAVQPAHEVAEVRLESDGVVGGLRSGLRRTVAGFGLDLAVGSRTIVGSTVGTVGLGALASLPLVFRILFPRLAARLRRTGRRLLGEGDRGRLIVERVARAPSLGRWSGFTVAEMADVVRRLLEDTGLCRALAPLVVVVGHGSTSLNNPHESAHDCGACGGSRGGPNARAFAQMANHPDVRRRLARDGLVLPDALWFVGAEHNTASDGMTWFDLDRVPPAARGLLLEVQAAFEAARRRNAHERCRRFDAVPAWYPARLALAHAETRAEDLAQPRPEYGHATNAVCVVGRRSRTRGLFLDRRAFLVSYDPTADDAGGGVLGRLLAAVVPVVVGINLEYYFGFVDPVGYGSGTKLPHNVTGLLGVMDGHASDLRTGLPWQMLEIHEPVRLTLVVESAPERLRDVLRRDPDLDRLVSGGWLVAAALSPVSGAIVEWTPEGWRPHRPGPEPIPRATDSASWFRGRRGPLAFASLGASAGARR